MFSKHPFLKRESFEVIVVRTIDAMCQDEWTKVNLIEIVAVDMMRAL